MSAHDDHGSTTEPTGKRARRSWFGIRRQRAAELFDAWLFAETEATLALAAWRSAPADVKAEAYGVYLAAVDREARAADLLAIRLAPA